MHPRITLTALLMVSVGCGAPEPEEAPVTSDALDEAFLSGDAKADAVITGTPTRYPIVLVHGFAASPTSNGFHQDIVRALCQDGHQVYVATLPPFEPVPRRAATLARQIDQVLAGTARGACGGTLRRAAKVNLLAHSMGGLDSRYLAGPLGYGDRVASVTTLSTPHRGSAIADMALGILGHKDDEALNALAGWAGRVVSSAEIAADSDLRGAFESLSEDRSFWFNAYARDDRRVYYQSWAGLSNVAGIPNPRDSAACEGRMIGFRLGVLRHVMHIALKPIAVVVAHGAGLLPNDALVTVESAKWGEFRGCIPADHADEIGAFPVTWSAFKYVPFYRLRAFELARRGF